MVDLKPPRHTPTLHFSNVPPIRPGRSGFPGGEHATGISHVEQYHGKPNCRGPLGSHQSRVFGAQRVVSAAGCEQPFPDRVVEQFPPRCAMPIPSVCP